jgi:hypothetical protein
MYNVPKVNFCGKEISRLIVGGNCISGTSHRNKQFDNEMEDYFTYENIKAMLRRCEELGINTMQFRGDKHIMRLIREYEAEGGNMNWVAQSTPELASFEGNVKAMAAYKPALMYHHGVQTDNMFKAGQFDKIKEHLKMIRDTGIPVGIGTHRPEVIYYAEEHNWDVDFYMACLFNISVPSRQEESRKQQSEDPLFVESDAPLMYKAVRSTDKPVLLFKILAGQRRCTSQGRIKASFEEAFANIKYSDCIVVGMFPKNEDQVALNAKYTCEAIEKAKAK